MKLITYTLDMANVPIFWKDNRGTKTWTYKKPPTESNKYSPQEVQNLSVQKSIITKKAQHIYLLIYPKTEPFMWVFP